MTEQDLVEKVWDLLNDASRLLMSHAPKSVIADTLYKDIEHTCEKADKWLRRSEFLRRYQNERTRKSRRRLY